jgi:hypothetical protein
MNLIKQINEYINMLNKVNVIIKHMDYNLTEKEIGFIENIDEIIGIEHNEIINLIEDIYFNIENDYMEYNTATADYEYMKILCEYAEKYDRTNLLCYSKCLKKIKRFISINGLSQ